MCTCIQMCVVYVALNLTSKFKVLLKLENTNTYRKLFIHNGHFLHMNCSFMYLDTERDIHYHHYIKNNAHQKTRSFKVYLKGKHKNKQTLDIKIFLLL